MSKKPRKFDRIYYRDEDGFTIRADTWGKMNDRHTQLHYRRSGKWYLIASVLDHGNGIHIEGDKLSLDLDYGTVSDLRILLDALDSHLRKKGDAGMFTSYHKQHVTVRRKRRK